MATRSAASLVSGASRHGRVDLLHSAFETAVSKQVLRLWHDSRENSAVARQTAGKEADGVIGFCKEHVQPGAALMLAH